MTRALDRVALGTTLLVLALTPWPLGSRLPAASMAAVTAVVATAGAWAAGRLVADRLRWTPLYWPILAFLAWTALQWALGWTVYRHATAVEAVRLLSYAALFVMVFHLAADRRRAELLVTGLSAIAFAVALFSLVQFFTWNGLLYWAWDPPYEGIRYGPFNNANYFPGYMVPAVAPALALLVTGGIRQGRALYAFFGGVSVLAILVGLSRGGALALAAMLASLVLLAEAAAKIPWMRRAGRGARVGLAAAAALVLVLGALVALGQADRVVAELETITRASSETAVVERVALWRDAAAMATHRPVTGFGLDTFGWVLPGYRSAVATDSFMHAHNEYLEVLVETGLPGAAACLAFVALLLGIGWRRLRDAPGRWEPGVRLGALAGWIGILVYGLTDFPTIIPATDYVLAALAALAVAPIGHGSRGGDRRERRRDGSAGRRRRRRGSGKRRSGHGRSSSGGSEWRAWLDRLFGGAPRRPSRYRSRRRSRSRPRTGEGEEERAPRREPGDRSWARSVNPFADEDEESGEGERSAPADRVGGEDRSGDEDGTVGRGRFGEDGRG